jgi:hypothetical protein
MKSNDNQSEVWTETVQYIIRLLTDEAIAARAAGFRFHGFSPFSEFVIFQNRLLFYPFICTFSFEPVTILKIFSEATSSYSGMLNRTGYCYCLN